MDKDVKMVLSVRLVELMVNIETQIYINHVVYEKLRPILYSILNKDLYS